MSTAPQKTSEKRKKHHHTSRRLSFRPYRRNARRSRRPGKTKRRFFCRSAFLLPEKLYGAFSGKKGTPAGAGVPFLHFSDSL